jgi:hypothetical protein
VWNGLNVWENSIGSNGYNDCEPLLGAGCRQFESGRPDHFKNLPTGEVFYYAGRSVRLFRYAKRSNAQFCETQNIPPLRAAHPAGRFQRNLNLAVSLVSRSWITRSRVPPLGAPTPSSAYIFNCLREPCRRGRRRSHSKLTLHPGLRNHHLSAW